MISWTYILYIYILLYILDICSCCDFWWSKLLPYLRFFLNLPYPQTNFHNNIAHLEDVCIRERLCYLGKSCRFFIKVFWFNGEVNRPHCRFFMGMAVHRREPQRNQMIFVQYWAPTDQGGVRAFIHYGLKCIFFLLSPFHVCLGVALPDGRTRGSIFILAHRNRAHSSTSIAGTQWWPTCQRWPNGSI